MRGVQLAACLASTAMSLLTAGITGAHADKGVVGTHYDGVTNDLLTAGLGKTGPRQPGRAPASSIHSIRRRRNFAGSRSTTTTAPLSTRRRAAATARCMART